MMSLFTDCESWTWCLPSEAGDWPRSCRSHWGCSTSRRCCGARSRSSQGSPRPPFSPVRGWSRPGRPPGEVSQWSEHFSLKELIKAGWLYPTNFSSCLKEVAAKAILKIDSMSFSYIFDDVFKSAMKPIRIDDILIEVAPGSDDW